MYIRVEVDSWIDVSVSFLALACTLTPMFCCDKPCGESPRFKFCGLSVVLCNVRTILRLRCSVRSLVNEPSRPSQAAVPAAFASLLLAK